MNKKILATLSIIPSILLAIFIWIIFLPRLLWEVPKDNYYRIAYNKIWVKYTKNEDGTYKVMYHGKTKIFTEEEFARKFGADKLIK